jgi:hypothetical protein
VRTPRAAIRLTANFEANLTSIEAFCSEEAAPQTYDRLLDTLLQTVIPDLEPFPQMGPSFLAHRSGSVEARRIFRRVTTAIGWGEIREYLFDDYLVLYAIVDDAIYLLSIKHHRQLSFDLQSFWRKPGGRHGL